LIPHQKGARETRERTRKAEVQLYRYVWKNNEKRKTLYDRVCRIVERLKMNSIVIQFLDNGQIEVVSRYAVRRLKS